MFVALFIKHTTQRKEEKREGSHRPIRNPNDMTPKQIATVVEMINSSNAVVAKAMVILLSFQTRGERAIGATVESNGKGFSHRTEHRGTYFAKWVLNLAPHCSDRQMELAIDNYLKGNFPGRALTGRFVSQAREIALLHRRQLESLLPKVAFVDDAPPTVRLKNPEGMASMLFSLDSARCDSLPETLRS